PASATPSANYEQGWNAINELIRADHTWSGYERNTVYWNHGDGKFSDISGVSGLDLLEDGRAFALADFDHDGRLRWSRKTGMRRRCASYEMQWTRSVMRLAFVCEEQQATATRSGRR